MPRATRCRRNRSEFRPAAGGVLGLIGVLLGLLGGMPGRAGEALPDRQRGITYFGSEQTCPYRPALVAQTLPAVAATGANWVAIVAFGLQTSPQATTISYSASTRNDWVAACIARAHRTGLRVMLKLSVYITDEHAGWHGDIGMKFRDEEQCQRWFRAYRAFVLQYALLAEDTRADMLCIGTELAGVTTRTADWRALVADVRARYHGPLTYASTCDGEETAIQWWDALDYIGIDAYYELCDAPAPTVDQLTQAWQERGYLAALEALAQRTNRRILFTEIGYRSIRGAAAAPWDWGKQAPVDLQEQATAYRAALAACWDRPWLAGMYWWCWDVDPARAGPEDAGYSPAGKPAETVLSECYRRPAQAGTTP